MFLAHSSRVWVKKHTSGDCLIGWPPSIVILMTLDGRIYQACVLGLGLFLLESAAWPNEALVVAPSLNTMTQWTPPIGATQPATTLLTTSQLYTGSSMNVAQTQLAPSSSDPAPVQSLEAPLQPMSSGDSTLYTSLSYPGSFPVSAIPTIQSTTSAPGGTFNPEQLIAGMLGGTSAWPTSSSGLQLVRSQLLTETAIPSSMFGNVFQLNDPLADQAPEPDTWILAGGALGAVALWQWKRRRLSRKPSAAQV
jgi:hypothetical protein